MVVVVCRYVCRYDCVLDVGCLITNHEIRLKFLAEVPIR